MSKSRRKEERPLSRRNDTSPALDYLKASASPDGITGLFIAYALYDRFGSDQAGHGVAAVALLAAALLQILQRPRWVVYSLVCGALILSTYTAVLIDANGPQDAQADRDDAVEAGARAFLAGQDPWQARTMLSSAITTGPASLLLAVPFVAAFDSVNGLTWLFWLGVAGLLLAADLRRRNDSFPLLAAVCLVGVCDVASTQYWALDELYYPLAWLGLACAGGRAPGWVLGFCVGAAVLTRANYAFVAAGIGCWLALERKCTSSQALRMLAGVGSAVALIVAPLLVRAGPQSLASFAKTVFQVGVQPAQQGSIASLPEIVATALAGPRMGRVLLACLGVGLLYAVSRRLRPWGIDHPFWHMAIGAFVAHTMVWHPVRAHDYTLMFVLPVLFAVAERQSPQKL